MKDIWQDYITTIYKLNTRQEQANNKSISTWLHVSPPTVTEMLKKLVKEGLVIVDKGCVCLSDKGIKEAKKILSIHRLWEIFLQKELDYSWKNVHQEAKRLQYATSDLLLEKLNSYLDYPKACPHGGIIFINNQEEDSGQKALNLMNVGQMIQICRLFDNQELLEYADRKGIKIGNIYTISNYDTFDGTITISNQEGDILVGAIASSSIFVKEYNK